MNTRVQNFPLTTLRWTTAPSVFSFPKWKVSSRSSMRMYPTAMADLSTESIEERAVCRRQARVSEVEGDDGDSHGEMKTTSERRPDGERGKCGTDRTW